MRSTPGSEIFSSASIPKPVSIGPMPMIPVIETSAGKATFSFRATNFNAPKKQARLSIRLQKVVRGWFRLRRFRLTL